MAVPLVFRLDGDRYVDEDGNTVPSDLAQLIEQRRAQLAGVLRHRDGWHAWDGRQWSHKERRAHGRLHTIREIVVLNDGRVSACKSAWRHMVTDTFTCDDVYEAIDWVMTPRSSLEDALRRDLETARVGVR